MRRLLLVLAAGALAAAVALGLALIARRSPTEPRVTAAPAPTRERISAPPPPGSPPSAALQPDLAASRPAPSAVPNATPSPPGASRADAELVALEERALRRIDVIPLLEASGVDMSALRQRADADDVMRRVAADELLTRKYMRLYFSLHAFSPGVPRDVALHDARVVAEQAVAELDPAERARQLALELAEPESPPPEPGYSVSP